MSKSQTSPDLTPHLTPGQAKAFARECVVPIRGLVSDDWLEVLADAIEADVAEPGPFYHGYETDGGRFHGNRRLWEGDRRFRDFCFESPLPAAAQQLLSGDKNQPPLRPALREGIGHCQQNTLTQRSALLGHPWIAGPIDLGSAGRDYARERRPRVRSRLARVESMVSARDFRQDRRR
jgi:hypothetical protein